MNPSALWRFNTAITDEGFRLLPEFVGLLGDELVFGTVVGLRFVGVTGVTRSGRVTLVGVSHVSCGYASVTTSSSSP